MSMHDVLMVIFKRDKLRSPRTKMNEIKEAAGKAQNCGLLKGKIKSLIRENLL